MLHEPEAAANLAYEGAKRAARAALAGVRDDLACAKAISELVNTIAHEAFARGVPLTALLDGLTRGLVVACHDGAPDFASRSALLASALDLARSQLGVLKALDIPGTPFRRAAPPAGKT